MILKVGTFNLNNLFSRFNFKATITEIQQGDSALTVRYEFTDQANFRLRTFMGKLVKAKEKSRRDKIAARIAEMDVDVLAVQEVENIDILKEFNRVSLGGLYEHVSLIEGNDPRLIDVGVLSKLPIGAVTSFRTAVHPSDPSKPVFGRDLLEVEIMNRSRTMKLFTLYNNHLKSHFGDDENNGLGKLANDDRRSKQADTVRRIVGQRMRSDARYIITGDMNDAPGATPLSAMLTIEGNALINGLADPTEQGAVMKDERAGEEPTTRAWTHRFRPRGQPPEHTLFDQIWLSPGLAPAFRGGFIHRRRNLTGDGSDHDPAWIELDI